MMIGLINAFLYFTKFKVEVNPRKTKKQDSSTSEKIFEIWEWYKLKQMYGVVEKKSTSW